MSERHDGVYAKGIAGIEAWKRAISTNSEFDGKILALISERLMCHGDALDCLTDGRGRASVYFKKKADEMPEHHEELMSIAGSFEETMHLCYKMFDLLEGFARGEKQMRNLADKAVREQSVKYITQIKDSEEKALMLLKELREKL